ncbi:hypothetical protein ONZ45_g18491 [Pleurotus djamor]|nr:hypothetical protein ONZ45_g18491 [Pleurotus djamor]
MNDIDASSKLTREEMEGLIGEVLSRIVGPIQQAIQDSELTLDQIDSVELIGGSTRVPAVRARIQEAFPGKVLSTTLNQDEAIARGATFACAMLSPVFRVRDFHVHDTTHYPIKVQWEPIPTDPDDDTELVVYPKGNGIPSTKVLTFYRKDAFDIEARYAEPEKLPGGVNPWIARFSAKEVPADPKGDVTCVKLKTKLNLHGIMSFETAYVEEVEEKEEPQPMEVDAPADGAPPVPPKKKKIVKKKEIKFVTGASSLDKSILEQWKEAEAQMHAADKLVQDTEDRKNALEEYVYDMRGKLDDRYASYHRSDEKSKLLAALQEAEDWLYSEEGEDATKTAYVTRLDALKLLGDPISNRYRQNEDRPKAISQLRETLNLYMSQATSGDDKYSHIDEKDKQSVIEKVATVQKWLDDNVARQAEKPKNADPTLTTEEISKKRDDVIYFATPIMTKPKPKVVPTPGSDTPKNGTETPKEAPEPSKGDGPTNMDVD